MNNTPTPPPAPPQQRRILWTEKGIIMKQSLRQVSAIILGSAIFMSGVATPDAYGLGPDDRRVKNQRGDYTVKCQVHGFGPGNPTVGYVVGNHKRDPDAAETKANEFVKDFKKLDKGKKKKRGEKTGYAKRHCYTQKKFIKNGSYDQNMKPL